jgi:hypothetical protein
LVCSCTHMHVCCVCAGLLSAIPIGFRLVSPKSVYARKMGHYSREVLTEVRVLEPGYLLNVGGASREREAMERRVQELEARQAEMEAEVGAGLGERDHVWVGRVHRGVGGPKVLSQHAGGLVWTSVC